MAVSAAFDAAFEIVRDSADLTGRSISGGRELPALSFRLKPEATYAIEPRTEASGAWDLGPEA
jgi:hypothetical protein